MILIHYLAMLTTIYPYYKCVSWRTMDSQLNSDLNWNLWSLSSQLLTGTLYKGLRMYKIYFFFCTLHLFIWSPLKASQKRLVKATSCMLQPCHMHWFTGTGSLLSGRCFLLKGAYFLLSFQSFISFRTTFKIQLAWHVSFQWIYSFMFENYRS